MWYQKFDSYIRQLGYYKTDSDPCMYVRQLADESRMYVILYVDNMLIAGSNQVEIRKVKRSLQQIHDEATRTSPTHTRHEDRAKSDDQDSLILLVRLYLEDAEALQHGECEASTNTTSDIDFTIRQRLSFNGQGERA